MLSCCYLVAKSSEADPTMSGGRCQVRLALLLLGGSRILGFSVWKKKYQVWDSIRSPGVNWGFGVWALGCWFDDLGLVFSMGFLS